MFKGRRTDGARHTRAAPLLLPFALLLAIVIVNPFRETLLVDDSFAYARMVQHLLVTGRYQLDAWAAANMPVQIYLAAALSRVFGYSLSLLRCSTLCLFVVALASFYSLLRELNVPATLATLLTLAIPATPLALMLAFTFMSDVQFLGWLLLTLVLYVRGFRRQSVPGMFLASLAAGCAIGTRQFGAAVLLGLVLPFLLPSRTRLPVRLLLAGAVVPVLATVAQLRLGLQTPNLTQIQRLAETRTYLASPVNVLSLEILRRCAVIGQYCGIAVIPLLPLALALPRTFWTRRMARVPVWLILLLACTTILAGLSISSVWTERPEARHHGLAVPLQLYWLLPAKLSPLHRVMWFLAIGGIVGSVFIVASGLRTLRLRRRSETTFLVGTALGLLLLYCFYSQFNDTYIVSLIPFALLAAAGALRTSQPRALLTRLSAVLCLSFIAFFSLWMRSEYAQQQALWNSADELLHSGVPLLDIWAPSYPEYHGSFSAWIAAGAPGYDPHDSHRYSDPLHDPYILWLDSQWAHAHYKVALSSTTNPPPGWRILSIRSFRTATLSHRYALTLARSQNLQQ